MKSSWFQLLSLKTLLSFTLLILFSSCRVGKKQVVHAKILPKRATSVESYVCGFGLYSFSGVLLCFGNDCTETGSTTTTLDFQANKKLIKTLSLNAGNNKILEGIWEMSSNCEIEIVYPDDHKEFYKYHPDIHRLELLNSNRQSYKGTLALLTIINQIN